MSKKKNGECGDPISLSKPRDSVGRSQSREKAIREEKEDVTERKGGQKETRAKFSVDVAGTTRGNPTIHHLQSTTENSKDHLEQESSAE